MDKEKGKYSVPQGLSVNEAIEEAKKMEQRKREERSWHEFWFWN